MPDPLPSTVLAAATLSDALTGAAPGGKRETDPADAATAPANRAARRGRASKQTPSGAVHADSRGRARAAQGRRINPVRRTG